MRKIVNGLVYDTEKSELIHTDFVKNRRLFRTKKGRFFMLYATGDITPKTDEAAMDYLAEHDVDKYMELFGEVEEA